MDSIILYLISLFGLITTLLVFWLVKLHVANPRAAFARHLEYPLLFRTGRFGLTRLHALIFVLFLSANVVLILFPSFFPGWREVQRRAALAAIVNFVPLSMGGRGVVIDALNMPVSWKKYFHLFVGVITVMEGTAHSVIAIALKPKPGQLTTSGLAVSLFEESHLQQSNRISLLVCFLVWL